MSALAPTLTAIKVQADADTGTGGLRNASSPLITAWYSLLGPQESATIPYVVVYAIDAPRYNVFDSTKYADELYFQFSVFCNTRFDLTVDQTIVDRIVTVFDRWAPTISGFTASQFIHTGHNITQVDDEVRTHALDFFLLLGK